MLGILGGIIILLISLGFYKISTQNQDLFIQSEIILVNQRDFQKYSIYGTCIDRNILTSNMQLEVQVSSNQKETYVLSFDKDPNLQCKQIAQKIIITQRQGQIQVILETIFAQTHPQIFLQRQIKQKYNRLNLNKKYFFIFSVLDSQSSNNQQTPLYIQIQNTLFASEVLTYVFVFSIFNIIGIGLVSFYRKLIFNAKTNMRVIILLLVFLIVIAYTYQSLISIKTLTKLAISWYIAVICIKIRLKVNFIILLTGLVYINLMSNEFQILQAFSFLLQIGTLLLGLQWMSRYGQFNEIKQLSIFNFLIFMTISNKHINFEFPLVTIVIFTLIMFGSTLFQILQLKFDLIRQKNKMKIKLQHYELSQSQILYES